MSKDKVAILVLSIMIMNNISIIILNQYHSSRLCLKSEKLYFVISKLLDNSISGENEINIVNFLDDYNNEEEEIIDRCEKMYPLFDLDDI